MEEPGAELESIQIPPHWNFPERDIPGLKVTALDLGERFLACDLPAEGESCDYFFDEMGKPTDRRLDTGKTTEITIGSDIQIFLSIIHGTPTSLFSVDTTFQKPKGKPFPWEHMGSCEFNRLENEREKARLSVVDAGRIFGLVKGEVPRSPGLRFYWNKKNENGLKTDYWHSNIELGGDFSAEQRKGEPYKIYCFDVTDLSGNPVYEIEWEVVEDSLVVTETYIPAQIRKILRAPLAINIPSVEAAILARPPYERDKYGFLKVPWREIGRIIGATLSYENLPQPEPENSS